MMVFIGNALLFTLVFGMSATVDINSILVQMKNVKALLVGMICQFLITPFLGYIVVRLLQLPATLGITLLVVTSSPGGSYSNWWCSLFNADLALSVTMSAMSTVLSIGFLPLNLLLYTKLCYNADVLQNLDWNSLFLSLAIVIGAISLGLLCSYKFHSRHFNKAANVIGNVSGLALIVMSATMANSGESDSRIWNQHWTFYVGTFIPCFGALVLATMFSYYAGLLKPECVTVGVEACYQNVGIATSLALTMFQGDQITEAMGIPFFYGVLEGVLVGIYCLISWKCNWTKAPANAPIWQVLITSYEILEAEAKYEVSEIEVDISESGDSDKSNERQDGSILTTYFNIAWLDPKPEETKHTGQPRQQALYSSPKLEHGEV